MEDHYETLGVPRDATQEQIRSAYRRAARTAHPDREGGSTERMQAVNAAYEVLGDEERRRAYDAGETEGSPKAKAMAILQAIFAEAIRDNVPDPFKFALGKIQRSEEGAREEIKAMRRTITRMEAQAERIKSKGVRDLYHETLRAGINSAENQVRTLEQNVESCQRVRQLLNDEYEGVPASTDSFLDPRADLARYGHLAHSSLLGGRHAPFNYRDI
jgi:curved DNA-binding protein CbpA